MDAALTEQLQKLVDALLEAESQAKRLLQTARAHRLSFGLTYNYIDDDIKRILGRLRFMQLMAERHTPADGPSYRAVNARQRRHNALCSRANGLPDVGHKLRAC